MSAFIRSPQFRFFVLAALLVLAAFAYFVVDAAVTNQIADTMTGIRAPKSQPVPLAP
jgi:hypothetical protein